MSTRELPMFPLGSAVLPGTVLPLHIFEPRYVQLLLDVGVADHLFGTALITRGREAGTDVDQGRADVGTLVRIVQSERITGDDGLRFAVVAVAESRLRVHAWLPDDPYPRAEVELLSEPAGSEDHRSGHEQALALLAEVLKLRVELGEAVGSSPEQISTDAALASFHVAALAGIGPLDAARLLGEDDLGRRFELLNRSLQELVESLRFQVDG